VGRTAEAQQRAEETYTGDEVKTEPETTKCKICGRPHPVDKYRGMVFYVCPDTMRVYLVNKEEEDGRDMQVDEGC
jgi:ribosomal protein S14